MTVPTPSQTAGPFVEIGTAWNADGRVVADDDPQALVIVGRVTDGSGAAVVDAMLEIWQADGQGRFPPASGDGWSGFGRALSDAQGGFRFVTRKPGVPPCGPGGGHGGDDGAGGAGRAEAPHIDVSIFARGLLRQLCTRIYFPDEAEANTADPFLAAIEDEDARKSLVAVRDGAGLRFDICLQGEGETVFFAP